MDRLKVLLVALLVVETSAKYSPELQVTLNHGGGLSGHFRTSSNGRGILAFTNIPYAEPPIGTLRFADPVKKAPWNGFLPRNKGEIQCPMKDIFGENKGIVGSEDCLYLFVYRPNIEKRDLPVMVYIHGGAYLIGSGGLPSIDPVFMLEDDVILVGINYRLGPLGFLTTFEGTLPGNLGLKDQQLALEWVRENIEAFGGDKNRVTLFGHSAGGASVGMHMFSHKSRGLFQQAIMQSGTPYDAWAITPRSVANKNAGKVIEAVECDKSNGTELLRCLQNADLEKLLEAGNTLYEWDLDPLAPFAPVLEMDNSPNPFIKAKDLETIPDMPLIIGVTHDEGAHKSAMVQQSPELMRDLEIRFDEILPSVLCYSHLDNSTKGNITKEIKEFYFNDTNKDFRWSTGKHQFTQITTDGLVMSGFDKFLQQRLAQVGNSSTFVYLFNYRGKTSFADLFDGSNEDIDWGVCHGDDVLLQFPLVKSDLPHRIMSQEDLQFGRQYRRMLTDFATYGDPAISQSFEWESAKKGNQIFLRIGNCNRLHCPSLKKTQSKQMLNMFPGRMRLWRKLIEDIQSSKASEQKE